MNSIYYELNNGLSPDEVLGPSLIEVGNRYFVPKANNFPKAIKNAVIGEVMLLEEFSHYEIAPDLSNRPNYAIERDLEYVIFVACYELYPSISL